MTNTALKTIAYETLLELATDDGIHASGRGEAYGCIFGRDSAITILKILKVNKIQQYPELLEIAKRTLTTLVALQGRERNIESGEEAGKFIHEFRKDNYERLITLEKPWYVYPDGYLRNYDSLDSTPLTLIALYRYWEVTQDGEFLLSVLPAVERGLNWIITYGDLDKDSLLEYELPSERKHGGLVVQSWTDSHESLRDQLGVFPEYPIAPVEVQGYAWLALKIWADYYRNPQNKGTYSPSFASSLESFAKQLKENFNKAFLFKDSDLHFASQALDGYKRQIRTITGNPLLLLWAGFNTGHSIESILDDSYLNELVERSFKEDLFDPEAGIRTMSTQALTYNPREDSYHNGSFWPKLNGMAHEGLIQFGFEEEANKLREASIKPLIHFGTPIELYVKGSNGEYLAYQTPVGGKSCMKQAWSAASLLDLVSNS